MRAYVLVGLLMVAAVLPAGDAKAPTLLTKLRTEDVQAFVDQLLRVPQIRDAMKDGEVLEVDALTPNSVWSGTVSGGATTLIREPGENPTHTIRTTPEAIESLLNAYDRANTAKLYLKAHYIAYRSETQANNLAYGAAMRTPAEGLLASYDPAAGQSITFQGCTGTLAEGPTSKHNERYLRVALCEANYLVDARGSVVAKVPDPVLSTVTAEQLGAVWSAFADRPTAGMGPSGLSLGILVDAYDACRAMYPEMPEVEDGDPAMSPAEIAYYANFLNFSRCLAETTEGSS